MNIHRAHMLELSDCGFAQQQYKKKTGDKPYKK